MRFVWVKFLLPSFLLVFGLTPQFAFCDAELDAIVQTVSSYTGQSTPQALARISKAYADPQGRAKFRNSEVAQVIQILERRIGQDALRRRIKSGISGLAMLRASALPEMFQMYEGYLGAGGVNRRLNRSLLGFGGTDVAFIRNRIEFLLPQQNLWVTDGSGRFPSL